MKTLSRDPQSGRQRLTWLLQSLALSGCASGMVGQAAAPPSAADIADAAVPVRCMTAAQCDRWWRAAQVWLVSNSSLKLQIATDAVLQTYSPTPQFPRWALTITRSPHLDGGELLEIRVDCLRGYACAPAYESVVADFKRYVLGVR